jgi:hypothetical protein
MCHSIAVAPKQAPRIPAATEPEATPEEIAETVVALHRWVEHARTAPARALERIDALAAHIRREFGLENDYNPDSSTKRPTERGRTLLRWLSAEVRVAVREARGAARPEDSAVWRQKAAELASELAITARASRKGKSRGKRGREQRLANKQTRDEQLVAEARALKERNPQLLRSSIAGLLAKREWGGRALAQKTIDAILATKFPA